MTIATLERAPRSGNSIRTIFTITAHDKTGTSRKQYVITNKGFIKCLGVAAVFYLLLFMGVPEFDRWAKREKVNSLRPQMEALAIQGQDEASLWMVKHYWAANKQRLAPLAAKGLPEAMYMQGRIQGEEGDKVGGMRWIARAASVGYADAVLYIEREKSR